MKKYNLALSYTQTIYRSVFADNPDQAEQKGYKVIADHAELKSVNEDVSVLDEKAICSYCTKNHEPEDCPMKKI